MKARKILTLTVLIILTVSYAHLFIHPVSAAPVYTISLDANSTSQTDTIVQTSFTTAKTFRVGAVINATAGNPLPGVFGWQFQINYDPSILIPQADPATGSLTDAAVNTVLLGGQAGCCNWAGAVSGGTAFVTQSITPGAVIVGFTFTTGSGVTINARTLLANVAFELLKKPTSPTSLTISKLVFVDSGAATIPNIIPAPLVTGQALASDPKLKFGDVNRNGVWDPGEPVAYDTNNDNLRQQAEPLIYGTPFVVASLEPLTSDPKIKFVDVNANGQWDSFEPVAYDSNNNSLYDAGEPVLVGSLVSVTISNDPPIASFTITQVSGYVFTFTSTSTDSDDTIRGFYWDFGDGTNDLNSTGSLITHDYSAATVPGSFDVSLRVVDSLGATGSARDSFGGVILNSQPSHTSHTVLADIPPVASFTFTPSGPLTGALVSFDASASIDADGTIASYAWDFNDTATATGVTTSHIFASARTYHVKLTVTDNLGAKTTKLVDVTVQAPPPPTVTLTAPSTSTTGTSVAITLSATSPAGTITAIKVNWGDGTTDTLSATATSASHTYATAGNYNITITATDDKGGSTARTQAITVSASSVGLPVIALIVIPIVAIIAAAILLLRRRRAPTKASGNATVP